ncbi:MAG: RNA methyltransferase [Muribaculaceae bacterium]|nr:RNA methyltransferase [Muribaculaceae bacterium]
MSPIPVRRSISTAERKTVSQLKQSKYRRESGLFLAEGMKCGMELLTAFRCKSLIATEEWLSGHPVPPECELVLQAKNSDMERMSAFSTAPQVMFLYEIPPVSSVKVPSACELSLALDCIQDPGNLGTIIRVADWMGVRHIYASQNTVDVYNPKVVQATMGSLARVAVHYMELPPLLKEARQNGIPVYGTFLSGDNIYDAELSQGGIVVMGNEGNGVSEEVGACVSHRLLIPPYPADADTAESLNVAVATAITLSQFRERIFKGIK